MRRSTLSLLRHFGMPQEDINPHMGWAYGSVEFQKYYRLVDAVQLDYDFFVDLLP